MTSLTINIFTENMYEKWDLDERKAIDVANQILNYYIKTPVIFNNSCLFNQDFDTISLDILYCDSEKTHQLNRDYREKDYPADIITFAIFADSDEKFIFDKEINLGEIIIALDKVIDNADEKKVSKEDELYFLISHGLMHLLGFEHETEESYNFIIKSQGEALKQIKG